VHGSGALIRWPMDDHLVDEIKLFTRHVVVGEGTRLSNRQQVELAVGLLVARFA
jgi:hypothetical protein